MQHFLLKQQAEGSFRSLKNREEKIDFGSNDTLGLAKSLQMIERASEILDRERTRTSLTGYSSTGSRLFSGNTPYAEQLENQVSAFHRFPSGLLFSCGYMANLSLLSSLGKRGATLLFDSQIHASSKQGVQMGRGVAFPFRHNDPSHLEERLKKTKSPCYICTESLFSTDGSVAPLRLFDQLADHYGAKLIVDETHAIGVYGPQGRGFVAEANLETKVFALVTSFAKGVGAYGAIVLGSSLLRSFLINAALPFIYTTALPLQNLAAIGASYSLFPQMDQERAHVHFLSKVLTLSPTHIQAFRVEGNEAVLSLAKRVEEQGFYASPLRSPTVRKGSEALRISLHAYNTLNQLQELKKWLELS